MLRGFSLIQISIILTVASLLLILVLPGAQTKMRSDLATINKLNTILTAMRQFESANGRLPCPANASLAIGATNYGVEAANPGASTNCAGGTPAANYTDAANNVAIGMVPVRALMLPVSYAIDDYGRDITYAVDTNATSCWSSASLGGQITVTDNLSAQNSVAALVSHGIDGHGAWVPLTGSSGTAVRLNSGSTDTDQLTNAHVNSSFVPTSVLNNFVKKTQTSTFNDLVVYKNSQWNINQLPVTATNPVVTVTAPANGTYSSGQTLTFVLNFPRTVTVTGTPLLKLSAIQGLGSIGTGNVAYASYVSGSGTNALTFTYTIISSDYAISGITLTSPILINGGAVTPCLVYFTSPDLSKVAIGSVIYVADIGNTRIQMFNIDGTYIGKFGTSGTGNGQFKEPFGVKIDASGNVWVADAINNNVQEFTANGNFIASYGSSGSGNGQFNQPSDMAFTSSGNFWITDTNNTRVEEFSSGGGYMAKFGAYGVGGGNFTNPGGIAIDSNGNIWVSGGNDDNVQEFTSSGAYIATYGSTGTGNGQLETPIGIAFDGSGNLWVVDNYNNRMEKFSSAGAYLAQFGTSGSGNGQFNNPVTVAIDSSGNLYVVDSNNNRVQKFTSAGTYLSQFGTSGSGNGQFSTPTGIAITR